MALDYAKLGLKSGVEIHQQLDTHKLFCSCQSELRNDNPDIIVKRRIYPVAGETGKVDVAAAYEAERKRVFVYEAYSDSTCEIELDEAPPLPINEEALKIALQIALLLNAKPLETIQVMRKTVVDGSNTSGFQRTLLLARDGYIETASGKINIPVICLEEDAARIVSQSDGSITFRLDRLGIPLVEIATAPEIKTPEQAKEVALKIGKVLRACKVKRRIGTIRQDVNLSIAGGARTEIKGVQEPELIAKTIEKEVERQLELIKQKKPVERTVRKANPDGSAAFLRPLPGAARMYPETDLPLVKITPELIKEINSSLPKLHEDIIEELRASGISDEYANILLKEKKIQLLRRLEKFASAALIAKVLALYPKEISSHEKIPVHETEQKLTEEILEKTFNALKQKKIAESSIKLLLTDIAKGKHFENALESYKLLSKNELEAELKKLIKEKKDLSINALMGLAMSKLKGKAEAREIAELLKKLIE